MYRSIFYRIQYRVGRKSRKISLIFSFISYAIWHALSAIYFYVFRYHYLCRSLPFGAWFFASQRERLSSSRAISPLLDFTPRCPAVSSRRSSISCSRYQGRNLGLIYFNEANDCYQASRLISYIQGWQCLMRFSAVYISSVYNVRYTKLAQFHYFLESTLSMTEVRFHLCHQHYSISRGFISLIYGINYRQLPRTNMPLIIRHYYHADN